MKGFESGTVNLLTKRKTMRTCPALLACVWMGIDDGNTV